MLCRLGCLVALLLIVGPTFGQSAEKWLVDRAVTVTPAAAPVPALKYRLFPLTSDRKDGNAVPIYLRFAHERLDATRKRLEEKPEEWNKLPLEKLPLGEVKEFLQGYSYHLRQLDLGARRKSADWSYTLDAGNPINLQLPDVQEMRMYGKLLVLKARVEIVEGRYADALRTLETGYSFSQQVSEAPLLINGLVGLAVANQVTNAVEDLVERADAPNLYWALAVLPRPLIDLRKALEIEQKLLEMQFPDLADLARTRPAAEWDAALKRVRLEMERIAKLEKNTPPLPNRYPTDEPAAKSRDLPAARKYLAEVVGVKAERLDAMPAAEVLLLYASHYNREVAEDVFKVVYLPYPQSRGLADLVEKRLKSLPDTEAGRLVRLFLPAIPKVQVASVRIERRVAMLQAVEALRMHAVASGKWPEKLEQVTVVPVPDDPGTGKPFEYRREGEVVELVSRIAGERLETTGLRYRVTLRK